MLQHRRDHARVRCLPQPLEDGRELAVDLGPGRVGDGPPGGVVLEVDRALGETVEPPAQGVAVELAEPEDAPEREHRDRLEVLAHQLGLATFGDRIEELVDDRRDELRRGRLDDPRPHRGVEHGAELLLRRAVEHEDARPAHHPVERRRGHRRVDQGRVRRCELDVGPSRHEPEADGRDEADGSLAAHARVDRIRILVELLDGDLRRPGLDGAQPPISPTRSTTSRHQAG